METLTWQGPKQLWHEDPARRVLHDPLAQSPGVYLWTVPVERFYLVNYVGMTATSIVDRLRSHLEAWLTGKYWIYEAARLRKGEKVRLYEPPNPPFGIDKYLENYGQLSPKVYEYLKLIAILYLPSRKDASTLKRIESGIIAELQGSDDRAKGFLDNHHPSVVVPDADKVTVKMRFPVRVAGLGEDVRI